jgi:hypothetical protein
MTVARWHRLFLSSWHAREPAAMMRNAMQSGWKTTAPRLFFSLDQCHSGFNLRRRRGFGSLHHGDARWSNGIAHTIRAWNSDHDPAGTAVPRWDVCDQRIGIFPDRTAHDTPDRAAATSRELASSAGGWLPRGLHHIFQLRVGNAQPHQRRRPMAGSVQCFGKCVAGLRGGLARLDHCSETVMPFRAVNIT